MTGGAIDEFRYCFDGDGKFPVAIVLGSDGIDDSFDTEENQVNFYVQTLESIVKNGIDTEKTTFLFLSFGSKDTPRPSQKRRGGKRKIDVCPKTPRIFSLILYRTNCSNRMDFGFLKIAAATPGVKAGDCSHNIARIAGLIREADRQGVSVAAFPELCITGYTCGDLFGQPFLIEQAERALARLLADTASCRTVCIAGMPLAVDNRLYNTAVVFGSGIIFGVVPKTYLPNYDEFYEARWFASGAEPHRETVELCGQQVPFSTDLLFEDGKVCFGVEICEDLWVPHPPSSRLAVAGATLLVNLSASDEMVGKHAYLRSLIAQQSARTLSAYLYSSAGFGESSTDVGFRRQRPDRRKRNLSERIGTLLARRTTDRSGNGHRTAADPAAQNQYLCILRQRHALQTHPGRPARRPRTVSGRTRFQSEPVHPGRSAANAAALRRNLQHPGRRTGAAHPGIPHAFGRRRYLRRLDSTLALLVAVRTFDKLGLPRRNILGVTMPVSERPTAPIPTPCD